MNKHIRGEGYESIVACNNCGHEYLQINGAIFVDGKEYCDKCFSKPKIPYFVKHVPNFYEGASTNIFTFTTPEEFFDKIQHRLPEGTILVGGGDCYILSLSVKKKFWWVLGGVNNYDSKVLNIPDVCGCLGELYTNTGQPHKENFEKIMKGKTIISAKGEKQ